MSKEEVCNRYFDWLYMLVIDKRYLDDTYVKLFEVLHERNFDYSIPMDGNRAEDGINLRYRFGRECDICDSIIAACLDDRPCSVLEMMIALAVRCEENIMEDPDVGDRTGVWFWEMLQSLCLNQESDSNIDIYYVNRQIDHFLAHQYKSNGQGGLFTVHHPSQDMRSTEIWYQMNWYLNEYITEGSF